MANIFSRRQKPKPDAFIYHVPQQTRQRIYHGLRGCCERHPSFSFGRLLDEMEQGLLEEYGELEGAFRTAYSLGLHEVEEHFLKCQNDRVFDFLELLFQCEHYPAGNRGVEIVNRILQEDGVGFELSGYVLPPLGGASEELYLQYGVVMDRDQIQFPQVIKKTSQYAHQEIVRPCLDLLSDPRFKTANAEMLKAHKEYRSGNYADAITDCGSVFETVMKTICEENCWAYDKDKATCKTLVDICKDNGLFPGFYAPFFIDSGSIRNKCERRAKKPAPWRFKKPAPEVVRVC
jgi:hypothetical protein